jgi:16S rRNA (cytidine1402-2'-O)-methyltransferase
MNTGTLYIVATPIGNMEDITFRAIRILKEVNLILCEDTRTTANLLKHYEINTKTVSYNAHSTKAKNDFILRCLKEGKDVALVSDAGTPCISDPGVQIVSLVRETLGLEAKVVPIPGASALISALSASGVSGAGFKFLGFLPHKKGRETILREIAKGGEIYVFYESTHRIMKALGFLASVNDDLYLVLARELTKKFEEFISGRPSEIIKYLESHKDHQRGEYAEIIEL